MVFPMRDGYFDLSNSRNAVFEENIILGGGLRAYNAENLRIGNNTILETERAFDVRGGSVSMYGNVAGDRVPVDPSYPSTRTDSARHSRGYERPVGAAVPSQCPRCTAIFPSRNYVVTSYKAYLEHNVETCPVCGYWGAKVADGLFDLSRDVIRIVSARPETFALVDALAGIAMSYLAGEIGQAEVQAAVAGIDPDLADVIGKAFKFGKNAGIFISAIIGALAGYCTIMPYAADNPDFLGGILSKISPIISEEVPHEPRYPQVAGTPSESPSQKEAHPEALPIELRPKARPDDR